MILGNGARESFWERLDYPPRWQLSLKTKQIEKVTEWASWTSTSQQQNKHNLDRMNTTQGNQAGTILKGLFLQSTGVPQKESSVRCIASAKYWESVTVSQRTNTFPVQDKDPMKHTPERNQHWCICHTENTGINYTSTSQVRNSHHLLLLTCWLNSVSI